MINSFNQALASLNTSRLQGHSLDIDSLFIVLFYGILLQCVQLRFTNIFHVMLLIEE